MLMKLLRWKKARKEAETSKPECLDSAADRKFIAALDALGITAENRYMVDGEWHYYAAITVREGRTEIRFSNNPALAWTFEPRAARGIGEALIKAADHVGKETQ